MHLSASNYLSNQSLFMNRIFLLIASLLAFECTGYTQIVSMDSTFSDDAFLQTRLSRPTMYSRPMAVDANGEIWLAGGSVVTPGLLAIKYNYNGDSIGLLKINNLAGEGYAAAAVTIQDDGKILLDQHKQFLHRNNENGTPDSTFGVNGKAPVHGVEIREIITGPDGKIYAAGEKYDSQTILPNGAVVLAFDATGRPDSSFSDDGIFSYADGTFDLLFSLRLQADGKVVVSGFSYYGSGGGRPATIYRFTTTGVLDSTFGTGGVVKEFFTGMSEAYGLAIQSDQKILITGYTYLPYHAVVARYLHNGQRDSTFGQFGVSYIPQVSEGTDMIIKPDGKILVYGWNSLDSDTHQSALFQLLPDGALDPSFGNNGIYFSPNLGFSPPMTFATSGDNKIVACGAVAFYTSNSVAHYLAIQRFITDLNVGTISPPVGLSDAGLFIYPNPVSSFLSLKFNLENAGNLDIELLDLSGKRVQTIHQNQLFAAGDHEESFYLDENLIPGQYVLCLWVAGKKAVSIQIQKN